MLLRLPLVMVTQIKTPESAVSKFGAFILCCTEFPGKRQVRNAEGEFLGGSSWEIKHSFVLIKSELQAADSCFIVIAEQNLMAVLIKVIHELHLLLGSV